MIGDIIDFFKSAQAPDGKAVWLVIGIFAGAWLLSLLLGALATSTTNNWSYYERTDMQNTFANGGNSIFFYGIAYVIVLKIWKLIPIVAHILIWGSSIFSLIVFLLGVIYFVGSLFFRMRFGDFVLSLNYLLVSAVLPLCTYIVYFVK